MPPRKKARLSSRAASTLSGDIQTEPSRAQVDRQSNTKGSLGGPNIPPDPWTDEQETSLFKSMIRWKPVGMHKHFRMIAISQQLRNHGYTSPRDDHTRIPGIWEKLGTLYNLEALDEREDSFGEGSSDDSDPRKEPFVQFNLPEDDFGDAMFARRLASPGTFSPPSLSHQLSNESIYGVRRPSTIDDTEEPRSSPASARGQRPARGTRAAKITRRSRLQESTPVAGRRASKASVGEGGEDEDEDQNAGEDEEVENEEDEDDGTATPSAKGNRGASKSERGKPKRGRRNARRGSRRR
ncbi:hypothetical protein MMC24_004305 [Lignoscripta atroalba]|nr:hypothetical protein [Lignoscripta atroalba]